MVGVLARRLTGKYIAPESKHLTERVEEIHHGDYDQLIEQIMEKPITCLLYTSRTDRRTSGASFRRKGTEGNRICSVCGKPLRRRQRKELLLKGI